MTIEDAIAELVAVKEAGVSARTLQRFSEAGYLSLHVDEQGGKFYSREQLREIFGSFQDTTPLTESDSASAPSHSLDSSADSPTPCAMELDPVVSNPEEEIPTSEETSKHSHPASATQTADDISRLRNLVSLQERMLDMKESELQDLRSQRDWLRTRVEKLEEKGDRDQVLLLSETQAIRQLIGLQQRRPSTIRSILEWLGFTSSDTMRPLALNDDRSNGERSSHAGTTIIVDQASNS